MATVITFLIVLAVGGCAWAAHQERAVSPEESLSRLKDGNARYLAGRGEHPRTDAARRRETAQEGQHPFATVVSCSDSRAPVEILFDQGIGDLFVVRVPGNVCNADEIAGIEYGIEHFHTPLCVVLGHTRCGAVSMSLPVRSSTATSRIWLVTSAMPPSKPERRTPRLGRRPSSKPRCGPMSCNPSVTS